jgi:hypothetical protein
MPPDRLFPERAVPTRSGRGGIRPRRLRFLPCLWQRLRMRAPSRAVPPAHCLRSCRIQVPSGRRACGHFSMAVGRRLIAHGLLTPSAARTAALPL